MKIAIAGFQHETNTFAESRACLTEFQIADSWPPMLTDADVISGTKGMNLPIAGAASAALSAEFSEDKLNNAEAIELIPILWCAAEPSGFVTDNAFDSISQMIIDRIQAAGDIDGVYLDLHGAMVTTRYEDGEGELLMRLRRTLGDSVPIAVSLDLHANVTPEMVNLSTLITVYRTYPHLDMADTGKRCMEQLIHVIRGQPIHSAFLQLPFLIPLHAQYTGQAPCDELYSKLNEPKVEQGEWAELALGFTAADIYHCGPSVLSYAKTQERADALAESIANAALQNKDKFDTALLSATEAVSFAMQTNPTKPVVIADVQDNPGAGGTSDTTGLLQALIEQGATGAVIGVICDADVALEAHTLGINTLFDTDLGDRFGTEQGGPLHLTCKVVSLSDGHVHYTGAMYGGGVAALGPSCLLAVHNDNVDIQIVVSSNRIQCLDRALFTHFGIDLSLTKIICVKSTVHHRADFEPISSCVLNAASPGAFPCLLRIDDYQHLRPGVECL